MTSRALGIRTRHAAIACLLGMVLTGCADDAEPVGTSGAETRGRPGVDASLPSGGPSLPPGDPGPDAPAVPDPGVAGAEAHEHGAGRRTVPPEALLAAADVGMVAGGRWEARAGGREECLVLEGAAADRTRSFGGGGRGVLVQTVASYADHEQADAAVQTLAEAVRGCGWSRVRDPRLGSASVSAAESSRTMTAVSTEGVVVLLVGSGPVSSGWRWSALVDLAAGSSCPAAADGCH